MPVDLITHLGNEDLNCPPSGKETEGNIYVMRGPSGFLQVSKALLAPNFLCSLVHMYLFLFLVCSMIHLLPDFSLALVNVY